MATYRRITVSVPQAPVSEALPETMTFYVDTRFTAAQVSRLRSLIAIVLSAWRLHHEDLNEGSVRSRFQNCVNSYARFNLSPVWFEERITNGAAAAAVAMDGLTTMIAANGFGRAARAYIMYQRGGSSTVRGVNASNPEANSLSVTVNAAAIDNTTVNNVFLAGSLFHAWLHREGYRHPTGRYTGYFAGEAAMCVMRGYSPKIPTTPVSTFTRWLD